VKRSLIVVLAGMMLVGPASNEDGFARTIPQEVVPAGKWDLQNIVNADGRTASPGNPFPYTIEFYPGELSVVSGLEYPDAVVADAGLSPDGRIGFATDCTEGSADYYLTGTQLEIVRLVASNSASTYGGCQPPSPLAEEFEDLLLAVTGYAQEGDELTLFVQGGGQLRFAATPATPVVE
jgi:hypothetical protein